MEEDWQAAADTWADLVTDGYELQDYTKGTILSPESRYILHVIFY
jgi:hypothetical protein